MIELAPDRIAAEVGGEVARVGASGRPARAVIDSREVGVGDLFFGLRGSRSDGGEHAAAALEAGAWGVVVDRDRAATLANSDGDGLGDRGATIRSPRCRRSPAPGGASSAARWSGSPARPARPRSRTSRGRCCRAASTRARENFNTEIGLPLTILEAPAETEVLVLEMAMRGIGQIAELCEIAEPDVAAITNVGPVHLELLGTVEAIAEAKAEILSGLGPDGRAVVPADAEALEPHLADELETITFGPGGDVFVRETEATETGIRAAIVTPEGDATFELGFTEAHNLANCACAIAIGVALGADPGAMARRAADISFSRLRGELVDLPAGAVLVNDCYNANPISMQAALDHLASLAPAGRRIAVLGGMAELGPDGPGYHREAAAHARGLGIERAGRASASSPATTPPTSWAPDAEAAVELIAGRCSSPATRSWSRARARSGSSASPTRWSPGSAPATGDDRGDDRRSARSPRPRSTAARS